VIQKNGAPLEGGQGPDGAVALYEDGPEMAAVNSNNVTL
jgi:hypothetical protein